MFIRTISGKRWIKPVLITGPHIEMSLTDEQCESFPWNAMYGNMMTESHRQIILLSGTVYGEALRLLKTWKARFNLNDLPESHLMVRMQAERTTEELAVAMGKHPRLGQTSLFGRLEPEILQLICDLAYY